MSAGAVKGILLPALFICCQFTIRAQTNIGGTINTYTSVSFVGPCPNKITVGDPTGFAAGNTVIIIQMQGATIDETNTATFGTISAYNSSGLWEKAVIMNVVGNVVSLTKNLVNTYSIAGKVQLIKVPTYTDANVTSTLTGSSWNGTTGGVVALEVSGTLTLGSAGISASGIGFRGGSGDQTCPNGCNFAVSHSLYYYGAPNYRAAYKGEGIAEVIVTKELGRGAQANGGGGGNDHNNGGGGGGNYSLGGTGGNNDEPGGFNCKGFGNYGIAGKLLNYASFNRVFLGGGGGAGHGNNGNTGTCGGTASSGTGGNGGGLIIIIAGTINGNGQTISSTGSPGQMGNGDGGGGGGAGGTIVLTVGSYTNNLILDVRGGSGGNGDNFGTNRCLGAGGGGGAGGILSNAALPGTVTTLMGGGSPGVRSSSTNPCNNTSGTATAGGTTATILTPVSVPQGTLGPNAGCGLPVYFLFFKGKAIDNKVQLQWATSTEVDASHFSVERSSDNMNFSEIGIVNAAGNTSTRTDYVFMDSLPYPGRNYYRLRQIDVTGYEKFTHVLAIDILPNALVKHYYPNPVEDGSYLYIEYRHPEKDHHIRLLEIDGRVVRSWIRSGNNRITDNIRLQGISPGVYLVEVSTPEKKQVLKLIVQ